MTCKHVYEGALVGVATHPGCPWCTIESLQSRLHEQSNQLAACEAANEKGRAELSRAMGRLDSCRGVLRIYGAHLPNCHALGLSWIEESDCTCGFSAKMREACSDVYARAVETPLPIELRDPAKVRERGAELLREMEGKK